MDKELLNKFIAFAKEKYGLEVEVVESDTPDSFEKLFGYQCSEQDTKLTSKKSKLSEKRCFMKSAEYICDHGHYCHSCHHDYVTEDENGLYTHHCRLKER